MLSCDIRCKRRPGLPQPLRRKCLLSPGEQQTFSCAFTRVVTQNVEAHVCKRAYVAGEVAQKSSIQHSRPPTHLLRTTPTHTPAHALRRTPTHLGVAPILREVHCQGNQLRRVPQVLQRSIQHKVAGGGTGNNMLQ